MVCLHFVILRRFSESKLCISLKMESCSVSYTISHTSVVSFSKEGLWGAEDAWVVRLVELSVLTILSVFCQRWGDCKSLLFHNINVWNHNHPFHIVIWLSKQQIGFGFIVLFHIMSLIHCFVNITSLTFFPLVFTELEGDSWLVVIYGSA